MNSIANIVIIGGGITGTPIAYNLAKKGFENIILIENIRGKTIQVDHLLGIALHGPRCWHTGRVVAFRATTPVQIQDGRSYSHEKFNAYSSER